MDRKKIIFIKLLRSSFINIDEKILSNNYEVTTFQFEKVKGISILKELFSEFVFMLRHVRSNDLIYIWFADFHAVIPTLLGRIFGKKVVIVIGGVDAAYLKDLRYGVKTRVFGRISLYLSTKFATNLLPVSRFTYDNLLKNVSRKLSDKCKIIYNCYNDLFKCSGNSERKTNVVTVCSAKTKTTVFIKGVDFYIDLANSLPELTFYVVGVEGDALKYLQSISGQNVVLLPKIPQHELKELFCSSKIICQFSRHEAFGVALIEGISAGCYPIGYNYGGTKEILTDGMGILINELDVDEGKKAIVKGLKKTQKEIERIKNSINRRFNIEVRKKELLTFIKTLA